MSHKEDGTYYEGRPLVKYQLQYRNGDVEYVEAHAAILPEGGSIMGPSEGMGLVSFRRTSNEVWWGLVLAVSEDQLLSVRPVSTVEEAKV